MRHEAVNCRFKVPCPASGAATPNFQAKAGGRNKAEPAGPDSLGATLRRSCSLKRQGRVLAEVHQTLIGVRTLDLSDGLAGLEALGLVLPGPAYIVGAVVFGLIGLAAFQIGRTRHRPRTRWLGLALMLYPYLVPDVRWMYAIGVALTTWVVLDWRRGRDD
jgi:hypothetical protein